MDKLQINPYDIPTIIGLALLTNCFSELLSFVFIYRKKKYKELTKSIQIQMKKIESLKNSLTGTQKTTDKKLKKMEAELKDFNFEMTKMRMASTFIIGLFIIFFMSIFSSVYQVR
jgi:peptidoglycan hydrolase CwlO-like protein